MAKKPKELTELWIAAAILLALSIYHLFANFNPAFIEFVRPFPHMPLMHDLTLGLYFWMLGLLFIAYQRWLDHAGDRSFRHLRHS